MTGASTVLRPLFVKRWKALSGAGAATVLLSLAELAQPWPIALAIDEIIAGHEGAFKLDSRETRMLAVIALLVVGIALVKASAQYFSDLWLQTAGERIAHELRTSVYEHLQRLSLGFHQRRQKGDLVTRVTGDVNSVGDLFAQSLGQIAQSALLLLGMIVVTFVVDPVLALASLVSMPVLLVVSVIYRRKLRVTTRRQREQEGQIASLSNEALSAMPVVKAFGSERFEQERVTRRSEKRMRLGIETSRLQARFDGLVGALTAAGTALVIVVGVLRVAAGALSPGDLVVFATYAKRASSPMRSIAREGAKAMRAMARAERVAELLAADELLEERPHAWRGPRAAGDVRLESVSFAYAADRPVLHEMSLTVPAGQRVALMGASGSGKSTLGALVARFYDPSEGRVLIDGRDARDCALDWVRQQVATVLQDTVLFTGTVAENIAYASEAGREEVVAAAKAAAAHDFIRSLPEGYDTELGPQGVGLSGGQRQRIGIARTLLRNPPVLVLDEPTTGLDSESKGKVIDGLSSLMRGRTTILITHSTELAETADHVVLIDEGRVVAEGTPGELLRADLLARLAPERRGRRRPEAFHDPALPQLERLLDPDEMAAVLQRSLPGGGGALEELRPARVIYKPGERATVHYRTIIAGELHHAAVCSVAGGDLADRVKGPRYVELARRVRRRTPAEEPVTYEQDVDAIVSWFPFDLSLPALAEPADRLMRALAEAGAGEPGSATELEVLSYKPSARAVLRLDGLVLKAYGKERDFALALAGLRTAASLPWLPTPDFRAALPELRLTAQTAVEGANPATAGEAAYEAGALARMLHQAPLAGLTPAPPEWQLAEVVRKAELVKAVLPGLEGRVEALVRRLAGERPAGLELVPTHGDFHVDQLIRNGAGLHLTDFDEMRAAPAAHDLAMYAADVVRGRLGDGEVVRAALEPLLEGYGARPAAMNWYLATAIFVRAPHPFNKLVPGWPQRVEATIAAAEAAFDRRLAAGVEGA